MNPSDPRWTDVASLFAKHTIQFIVHRHKICVIRSLENAKEESNKWRVPLYIHQAKDEAVQSENECKLTKAIQEELLRRVNPDATKGLPSFLPLSRGMRPLLSSKGCERVGLVKGCVCTVQDIILAQGEDCPHDLPVGQPPHRTFMPVSLLLKVAGALWILPKTELPHNLPSHLYVGCSKYGQHLLIRG